MPSQKKKKFGADGIQFACVGSGKCCVSHNGYGYVFLNKDDRERIAQHLAISVDEFTERYCDQRDGVWKLKDTESPECPFLDNLRCGIYEARPMQCRTWPFWPEVMNARTWAKDVAAFCPGVGQGKVWSASEVASEVAKQVKAEEGYGS